jgi:hypothetical protein
MGQVSIVETITRTFFVNVVFYDIIELTSLCYINVTKPVLSPVL